jgi:hypothetical protein
MMEVLRELRAPVIAGSNLSEMERTQEGYRLRASRLFLSLLESS